MLTAEQRKEKMKAVIRAGTGNFLELYDFLVYAYFAPYIARAFFPTENEFMSIMLALGTYGVASFARQGKSGGRPPVDDGGSSRAQP